MGNRNRAVGENRHIAELPNGAGYDIDLNNKYSRAVTLQTTCLTGFEERWDQDLATRT